MREASEMISSRTSTNSPLAGRPRSTAELIFALDAFVVCLLFFCTTWEVLHIRMQLTMPLATLSISSHVWMSNDSSEPVDPWIAFTVVVFNPYPSVCHNFFFHIHTKERAIQSRWG
jgi:hypothetical protein